MTTTLNSVILPPPNAPFLTADGKIERVWYLCLRQIVASIGGFSNVTLSNDDLQALTDQATDIASADMPVIQQRVSDLEARTIDNDLQEFAAIQDVLDALALSQIALDDAASALTTSVTTGPANPTAKVELTVTNGTATTYMRSDAAPPLDQGIQPTWTSQHSFIPTANNSTLTAWNAQNNTSGNNAAMRAYLSNTTNDIIFGISSTGFSGSYIPTAPAGQIAFCYTDGNIPLCLGSNAHVQLQMTTANVTFGNTTDNPTYTFAGSGGVTITGSLSASNFSGSSSGTNTGDQTLPVGANPTASVGTTAVNGTATTFMRSDGAPKINLAINPTWTAQHIFQAGATFTAGSGTAVTITAVSAQAGLVVNGTGGYFAVKFLAGTFPAMYATGQSAGSAFMEVDTSATTGTKNATMTATNKPGTNNQTTPAVWLPINCDGTVYYFPGYAA